MLYVDRSPFPRPEIYGSPELKEEKERLSRFYEEKQESGLKQARSPIAKAIPLQNKLLAGVRELFNGKCAYCEQPVERKTEGGGPPLKAKLDLFRPHSEAVSLDGSTDPDHYWWLAFEWQNHYLACSDCLRYKRSQFPVHGDRVDFNPRRRTFKRDKGLLLDPCHDVPHLWLEFGREGKVRPASPPAAAARHDWGDLDRGEVTIEILSLNRSRLVDSRGRMVEELERTWSHFLERYGADAAERLESLLTPYAPHAGMSRQILAGLLLDHVPEGAGARAATAPLREELEAELDTLRKRRRGRPAAQKRTTEPGIRKAKASELEAGPAAARTDEAEEETPSLATVRIQRLEIKNYKAIHALELSFNENGDLRVTEFTPEGPVENVQPRAGWEMLLGENGTGKSTVLEAIASVLLGPRLLDEKVQRALDIPPGKVLRRGSRWGRIRVTFVGDDTLWELRFTKTRYTFPNGAPVVGTFVRGYGATRLLPGRSQRTEDPTDGERVDIGNLFNPFVPLVDADAWLMGLDEERFTYAARAITDLLNRAEDHFDVNGELIPRTEELITKKDGHIRVDGDRLEHLSDGYRTVLAMCCDIMAAVVHKADMLEADGIVLVDEMGAHLHPSWKMRIVPALRRTFPAIQFVATTHEPLCLRGLLDRETVLMSRQAPGIGDGERRISAQVDLPSPSDMRVDQLLTSSLFGMDTTIDPDLDRKFSEFYYLLGLRDRTPEQDALCERLRDMLAEHGTLGYTRRDQKIYEIIDNLIAEERLLEPERRAADRRKLERLNERTRERVLALWRYADLGSEVRS